MQNKSYEIELFNRIAIEKGSYEFEDHDRGIYEKVIEKINELLGNFSGSVLEAGCGTGAFGILLRSRFPEIEVTGVDIASEMINRVPVGSWYKGIVGDLEDEHLLSGRSFDIIVCPFVLHHFPSHDLVIRSLSRLASASSIVVVIEPNGANIVGKLFYMLRRILEKLFGPEISIRSGWATPNERNRDYQTYDRIFAANGLRRIALHLDFPERAAIPRQITDLKRVLLVLAKSIFGLNTFTATQMFIIYRKPAD